MRYLRRTVAVNPRQSQSVVLLVATIVMLVSGCATKSSQSEERLSIYQKAKALIVYLWDGSIISYNDVIDNPKLENGTIPERYYPIATGFLVSLPVKDSSGAKSVRSVVITAKHVFKKNNEGMVVCRFNQPAKDSWYAFSVDLRSEPAVVLSDEFDLALIPIRDDVLSHLDPENQVLQPSLVCKDLAQERAWGVSEGAEVFSCGLLRGFFEIRNSPAFRFGHISKVVPYKWNSVNSELPVPQESYFVDMSGGRAMSGAPVFLDNSVQLVGVWKGSYSGDELRLPSSLNLPKSEQNIPFPQALTVIEPGRNVSLLIEKYFQILEKEGFIRDAEQK